MTTERNKSWLEEKLDQDVRVYKQMLDTRDALRSDVPEKKLVPMRSVQYTFGTHLNAIRGADPHQPFNESIEYVPPVIPTDLTCCLYPIGVPTEDLPDSVEWWFDGSFIATLIPCAECGDRVYNDTGEPISLHATIADEGSGVWSLTTDHGDFIRTCFISVGDDPEDLREIRDTFSLTYVITISGDGGAYTVIRETLCQWSGDGFVLRYNSSTWLWEAFGTGADVGFVSGIKDAPQNRPDGTYSSGILIV